MIAHRQYLRHHFFVGKDRTSLTEIPYLQERKSVKSRLVRGRLLDGVEDMTEKASY